MTQRQWQLVKLVVAVVIAGLVVIAVLVPALAGCSAPTPRPVPAIAAPAPPHTGAVSDTPTPPLPDGPVPPYDPKYFGGSRWAATAPGAAGARCTVRGLVLYTEATATGMPADVDGDLCADDGRL